MFPQFWFYYLKPGSYRIEIDLTFVVLGEQHVLTTGNLPAGSLFDVLTPKCGEITYVVFGGEFRKKSEIISDVSKRKIIDLINVARHGDSSRN